MQRTQRVLFSFHFGASLTLGCFPQGPQKIARGITRRATSTPRSAPRVLHARPVGRVQKRPPRGNGRRADHQLKNTLKKKSLKKPQPVSRTAKRWKAAKPVKTSAPAATTPVPRSRMAGSPAHGSWWAMSFVKLVTTLLIYVNMFLAGYAGAGLATTARLRYDPTTYVVAREMFPDDFALVVKMLPRASLGLLALAHLAVAALVMPRCLRFFMLMLYASVMLAMVSAEAWLAHRMVPKLDQLLREGRDRLGSVLWHIHLVLDIVAQWHGFAYKLKTILWEVEKDAPMNVVVMKRACVAFAALQVSGGVLAILAAITGLHRERRHRRLS